MYGTRVSQQVHFLVETPLLDMKGCEAFNQRVLSYQYHLLNIFLLLRLFVGLWAFTWRNLQNPVNAPSELPHAVFFSQVQVNGCIPRPRRVFQGEAFLPSEARLIFEKRFILGSSAWRLLDRSPDVQLLQH